MQKILLSAFACDPREGSELGYGWNWAIGLAQQGYEVHCLTRRIGESAIKEQNKYSNLHFYYITLPWGLEKMYSFSQATMYIHYLLWQFLAYKKAKSLHKIIGFNAAHHVTWGSVQLGSFLYKLPVPFVFGPAGGGQFSPDSFKTYFGKGWAAEEKRKKVSQLFLRYNPACKGTFKNAAAIWVSNPETFSLVKENGGKNVFSTLDAALPEDFFPADFKPKQKNGNTFKLLWVGRFMPRKGHMLLLDVMDKLRDFPQITLTMVGDGEQRELFENRIYEKKLEGTVFCTGKIPFYEVRNFYNEYDAFFFTSLRDSCPAQLIEAMSFGMPVISLNLHGQAVIVNDNTGFRCACATPEEAIESLTSAIKKLYHDDNLFSNMSEAAHSFALEQTWENKISKIVNNSYPSHANAQPV